MLYRNIFSRAALILLVVTVLPMVGMAQLVEPWQRWHQRPAQAPLIMNVALLAGANVNLSVSTLSTNLTPGADCSTEALHENIIAQLQPHVEYTLTVTGSSLTEAKIKFKPYIPYHLAKKKGAGTIVKPYKIFLDGVELLDNSEEIINFGSCGNNTKSWKVEIRPDRGFRPVGLSNYEEQWRRDEENVDELAPGDGLPLELGPGNSLSTNRAAMRWAVNMGRLWNGNSAGLIRLQEFALSADIYTEKVLSFTAQSTNTAELLVVTNGLGKLRQIRAPQALVDIQATNGQCNLKFYLLANVSSVTNVSGLFTINTDSPFVIWRIKNPYGTGAGTNLQLIEERPGRTNTSEIIYDVSTKLWSLKKGAGNEQITESRAIAFSSGNRIETIEIKQGSTNAYKAVETYHPYAWGWELTNVISGVTGGFVTNGFIYYNNPADEESYQKLYIKTMGNGSWEKWLYTVPGYSSSWGTSWCLRPWEDTPSHPNDATLVNSLVMTTSANDGVSLFERWGSEYYGALADPGDDANEDGLNDSSWHHSNETYIYEERTEHIEVDVGWNAIRETKANGKRTVESLVSVNYDMPGHYFHGMPRWVLLGNYKDARSGYFKGIFNPTTWEFEDDEEDGSDIKTVTYNSSFDANNLSLPWYFEWPFGYITMAINKTTRDTVIRRNGNVVLEKTEVYSDWNSGDPIFELISIHTSEYDSLGHLIKKTWLDPQNTNTTRVIYNASWSQGGGDAELKVYEIDETGTRFEYAYNSLKRLTGVTKAGATNSPYASQVNITTNLIYNATGQTLLSTVTAGALSLTEGMTYDQAGRVTSSTGVNGNTTNVAYSVSNRIITNSTAGGLTTIIENYSDGRIKSITGNAQIPEYYDYDVMLDGELEGDDRPLSPKGKTRINYGTSSSPRWFEQRFDLARRLTQECYPTVGGGDVLTNFYSYKARGFEFDNRRLNDVWKPAMDESGEVVYVQSSYYYDGFGGTNAFNETVHSGLRTTQSDVFYEYDDGDWFQVVSNYTGNLLIATNVVKTRLSGFASGNIISQVYDYDIHTNLTVSTVYVDRSNKLLTQVMDTPQSTLNATNIAFNGLLQLSSTPSVSTQMRNYYDALGRETTNRNSLGFDTIRTYNSYNQVVSQRSPAGEMSYFGYYSPTHQNAGMLYATTNALGKTTYFAYNTRGQTTHIWGDVPYPEKRVYDSTYGEQSQLHTYQGGSGWNTDTLPSGFSSDGNITSFSYDASTGVLTSKTDAASKSVSMTYWPTKQLKTFTWSRGVSFTNFYNTAGSLVSQTYSDATPDVTYAGFDHYYILPTQITDAVGERSLTYDYAGRMLTDLGVSGSLSGLEIENEYDQVYGRDQLMLGGTTPTLTQTYQYDTGSGRMSGAAFGNYNATYGYLANSDLLQTTTFKNVSTTKLTTTRAWDYGSRLRSISNVAGSATVASHLYEYDAIQRRKRATLEDGSAWYYDYNDRNEIVDAHRLWADFTPVSGQQFDFDYDNIGNRKTAGSGGDVAGANLRSTSYTVNSLNQYITVVTPGYESIFGVAWATNIMTVNSGATDRKHEYYHREISISSSGGPLWQSVAVASSATTSNGNFVFPKNSQTYTYDFDGNVTFDGIWTYEWDGENRLKTMVMTNVSSIPNTERKKLDFTYDYVGRRTAKAISAWNGTSAFTNVSTIKYLYNGWNLVAEVSASTVLRSYLWGQDLSATMAGAGGVGGLLLVVDHVPVTDTYHFPAYDGNGNVMALVNQADSSVSARYEYSPFGKTLRATGPLAKSNPYRFSSKFTDEESSLVYYGYRYYSPTLGRFINRDPIEEEGGLNLYAFVANEPVYSIDSLGEIQIKWREIFLSIMISFGSAQADGTGFKVVKTPASEKTMAQIERVENRSGNRRKSIGVGGASVIIALAAKGLETTLQAAVAASKVASGIAPESNMEWYFKNLEQGDLASADLDAAMAALEMGGFEAAASSVAWAVLDELGAAFSEMLP